MEERRAGVRQALFEERRIGDSGIARIASTGTPTFSEIEGPNHVQDVRPIELAEHRLIFAAKGIVRGACRSRERVGDPAADVLRQVALHHQLEPERSAARVALAAWIFVAVAWRGEIDEPRVRMEV